MRWYQNPLVYGVIVLLGGVIVFGGWLAVPDSSNAPVLASVKQENKTLVIRERGVIRPAQVVPVKNKLKGKQAQLSWLITEGEKVEKGNVIARFDSRPFMESLESAEQAYADSSAQLENAKKTLALIEEESQSKLDNAKRALELAQIKARDTLSGSGQLERDRTQQALLRANRQVELIEQELADFDFLLSKGHVSQRERDQIAEKLKSAQENQLMAKAEWENFNAYQWPRMEREAELTTEAARMEYSRVERTVAIELQQKQDQVVLKQRELESSLRKLERAQADLDACEIEAPVSGAVLHTVLPKPEGPRKSQVGDSLWAGQTFLEIPDTSALVVNASVREVDVAKISEGDKAVVTLDAIPDKQIDGVVERIEKVVGQWGRTDTENRFNIRISLSDRLEQMQPGMSAQVKIGYQQLDNILVLPLQALSYCSGEPCVHLWKNGAGSDKIIKTGAVGSDWFEIKEGLKAEDQVELLVR